jgi:hypothetical protein
MRAAGPCAWFCASGRDAKDGEVRMNTAVSEGMVFCRACGRQMHSSAAACPGCGAVQAANTGSSKKILPAAILCFFLGWLGAHRFYAGKPGTAILEFLACCVAVGFLWVLVDFIMIIVGSFTDWEGRPLTQWT